MTSALSAGASSIASRVSQHKVCYPACKVTKVMLSSQFFQSKVSSTSSKLPDAPYRGSDARACHFADALDFAAGI